MEKRDPPKPHILKEASRDMLAEPPFFASICHQNVMFFHASPGTAPGPPFFSFFPEFYRKSAILDPPLAPSWVPNGAQNPPIGPKSHQFLGRFSVFYHSLEPACFREP